MNSCCSDQCKTSCAYLAGIVGAFLIMAGMAWYVRHWTMPPPVGKERAVERAKNLVEQRGLDDQILKNYAWQNQGNDIVRLPVSRAMELTVQDYKDPVAARASLNARVDKATFVPPPPKNAFE
jgi:hypothetical protein